MARVQPVATVGEGVGAHSLFEPEARALRDHSASIESLPGRARSLTDTERAFALAAAPRPVLIAVPLFRHPELAEAVIESLIVCAQDIAALQAEVVVYNDSPDDLALAAALDRLMPRAQAVLPCRLEVNARNRGFVQTSNLALDEAVRRGMDALLLNSDTVVFPGALTEMARVSRLDPMTGFVNPRSNNATLATLPFQERFRHLPPDAAHAAWRALNGRLPEVSYAPTAVGFCLLIRWGLLAEFGGFDEIYGAGYNEENDLVMRAGRRGYRAVLANRAFVWHQGSASFGPGSGTHARDMANRALLQSRYPEYWTLTQRYFDSPEQRAEILLGALLPGADGRLQVAFDFSSFVPAHNGTFRVGAHLLEAAAAAWSERYELFVICAEDTYAFHGLGRSGVKRRDAHDSRPFAAIFRVGQPYDWGALERLAVKAPVFGMFMLDTISVDCAQLVDARTTHLWAYALEHSDFVVASSEMTAAQLERRFTYGPGVLRAQSLHSMDLADYRTAPAPAEDLPAAPGFIFVVGNHYWHKDVASTANALAAAYPDRKIVVLAGRDEARRTQPASRVDEGRYAPRGLDLADNIVRVPAGEQSDADIAALYAHASAVVFPSHYEGFGMPILDALAARRPVFARPLPTTQEIWRALGGDANLHLFATTSELVEALETPPDWNEAGASRGCVNDASRIADDILRAVEAALGGADYGRIVRRLRALHAGHDLAGSLMVGVPEAAPTTPIGFLARRAGRQIERNVARLLALPGVYRGLRRMWRLFCRLRTDRPPA